MMREKYYIPTAVRPAIVGCAHIANAVAGVFFDGIVTADPEVERDFRRFAGKKTLTYYNFPQLSVFEPSARTKGPVADLVYVGGLSDRSGIFVLLKALSLLAGDGLRPSVRLAGYTDGEAGRGTIEDAIKEMCLTQQIDFRGRIPHADVPSWIRSGRIGLVMLQAIPKFMKNIPSKLFEYWACGLPVIASDLPPIRQFLVEGKNGLFFDPSRPEDLARAIRYLLEHPGEAKSMGSFARKLVCTRWNVDRQIDDLIHFYERIHSN
jgi:glycosyltransferase involved in cell wall biosynthesis